MALSKIEHHEKSLADTGMLTLNPAEYCFSDLLNDVVDFIVPRLGEKPVTFSLNISDNLSNRLFGDGVRIKQILNNMLSNALNYTHDGKIELDVNSVNGGSNDVWVEFHITDTGIGISEDIFKDIFKDDFQDEAQTGRKNESSWLKLSVTKKLVEMMDGEITAESELGKGTNFHIRIRQGYIDDSTIGAETADRLRSFRDNKKQLERPDLNSVRVLVVDDMQANLDVAEGFLRKYNMQVDCVLSGQEAVELMRTEELHYNAIFLDYMMPGMNGIETADAIRGIGIEYTQKIPIIAVTANVTHGTEELFYSHGFQAYLPRPINIMQLDSIIRKWLCGEEKAKV